MDLGELPDFAAPLVGKGVRVYGPYGGGARHFLMPDELVVAQRSDGSPDFLLQFVKIGAGIGPSDAYGLLEFTVQAHFPMADGMSLLRENRPRATLAPVPFAGGFLRLLPAGPIDRFPDELREEVALAWNSLGSAPYAKRLSRETAEFFKEALKAQTVLVHAYADMEVAGVSPRLSVQTEFRPSALLDSLASLADGERRITRDALVQYFLNALKAPRVSPLTITGVAGDAIGQLAFAETMADRVRERFAKPVPAPAIGNDAYLRLAPSAETAGATYTWDLSQPVTVRRPFSLYLDPLLTARALVLERGVEAIYEEVPAPPLKPGAVMVSVSASLPEQRPGVWELGAELHAPPNPPARPGALRASVALSPPTDRGAAVLRFSPKEPRRYEARAYLVTAAGKQYGPCTTLDVPWLLLTPDDFPGRFILTSAGQELLSLATVHGTCTWTEGGIQKRQDFDLQTGRAGAAVWLQDSAESPVLALEARAHDGAGAVRLDLRPAASMSVDAYSFPQYGTQTLDMECTFAPGAQLLRLELLPEDRPETPDNVVFRFFTPEEPRQQWKWSPGSLFRAGYRYRTYLDRSPSPWSNVRYATEPLRLRAEAKGRGGG